LIGGFDVFDKFLASVRDSELGEGVEVPAQRIDAQVHQDRSAGHVGDAVMLCEALIEKRVIGVEQREYGGIVLKGVGEELKRGAVLLVEGGAKLP
jgi:hypothetical protein